MLKNLVGIVTGGVSGLGKGTVKTLINEGAKVIICDIRRPEGKRLAESLGPNASFSETDIRNSESVENMLSAAYKLHSRLDFLVNCAGIATAHKVYNYNHERAFDLGRFQAVFETNVFGLFNVIRLASGYIGKNTPNEDGLRGTIINTSGIEAIDGQYGQCAVAGASGAIEAMTTPLARELGEKGIRVMCICPGIISTPMTLQLPEKVQYHIAQSCPAPKRFGKPEEYAHTVKYILENPYINSTTIRLDGGLRIYLL